MEHIQEYLNTKVPLVSVLGLFVLVTALYLLAYLLSRRGNGKMDQHNTPEQKEQRAVADALNEALFNLLHEGKISQRRYNHYSSKLGKTLKLPGLLSKTIHPNATFLKQQIRARLGNGFGSPTLTQLDQKEAHMSPPVVVKVTGGRLKIRSK